METSRLVVDTDVIIDHLRRSRSVLPLALKSLACAITAITLYELHAVAELTPAQRKPLQDVIDAVTVEPLDKEAAERSAAVWRDLAGRGELISVPDILTAGICLQREALFLTRNNRHFSRVAGLRVISPEDLQARFGGA